MQIHGSFENSPRVLVVADHASAKWGGEAILPLHVFRGLRQAGCEAWLCVGDETRAELDVLLAADRDRILYVHEPRIQDVLRRAEAKTPAFFPRYFFYFARELLMQNALAAEVRRHARALAVDVIHQPMPVSPRIPSFLTRLPAPLVVGPLNGAMEYPRGFRFLQRPLSRWLKSAGRLSSHLFGLIARGKREAALILVANERTARALPRAVRARVAPMIENGVDPALWQAPPVARGADAPLELVFLGRLERWKGAEWLIRAMPLVARTTPCKLTIIGEYEDERARLEELAQQLGVATFVRCVGYMAQAAAAELLKTCDALVLPSVYECGGAVVLEAMAAGKPVIAVDWGGPADYVTPASGILVPASTPEALVRDLADAIARLAALGPEGRKAMGAAGRDRCLAEFAWPVKIRRLLAHYNTVRRRSPP